MHGIKFESFVKLFLNEKYPFKGGFIYLQYKYYF